MTLAAAGAILSRPPRPRLATPGAVILLAGLALLWWGLGVFRGEVGAAAGGESFEKRISGPFPKDEIETPNSSGGAGGQLRR